MGGIRLVSSSWPVKHLLPGFQWAIDEIVDILIESFLGPLFKVSVERYIRSIPHIPTWLLGRSVSTLSHGDSIESFEHLVRKPSEL